jgi:hypothetical protein
LYVQPKISSSFLQRSTLTVLFAHVGKDLRMEIHLSPVCSCVFTEAYVCTLADVVMGKQLFRVLYLVSAIINYSVQKRQVKSILSLF